MTYSMDAIASDLERLGLCEGDLLMVHARVRDIGQIEGHPGTTVLAAMRQVVGDSGTIATLTFTRAYPLPLDAETSQHVFEIETPTITGHFARTLLALPDAVRSRHPTCSFAAVGPDAEHLTADHDADAPCYLPIERLIEKNGKYLILGCVWDSPGFTSVHWAQWKLGLATQHQQQKGVNIRTADGDIALWRRRDIGGCSGGFHKFYPHYRAADILCEGKIGQAECMMVPEREALEIELRLLTEDPCFALCEDPTCFKCWRMFDYSRKPLILFKLAQWRKRFLY